MRTHALASTFLCLIASQGISQSPAESQYRVVVQEAHPHRYGQFRLTSDFRYAVVATGANDHILHIIDPRAPVVLRRFYLPKRIHSTALDTATGRLAVSTDSAIYLGNMKDEHLHEALPGVSGLVEFQQGGPLLAVLGQIPDPTKRDAGRLAYFDSSLGVFDLDKKEWRFVRHTPIVTPFLFDNGVRPQVEAPLLFHEGALLAGGIGGSVGSMIPITRSVDVHLDLTSGKAKITMGPNMRYGKVIEDEPLPLAPFAVDNRKLLDQDKNVELKREASYKPPAALVKAHERLVAAIKKLEAPKLMETLRLEGGPLHDGLPMPFAVKEDRVQVAVRRFLPVLPGGFGSRSAVLNLTRDGAYSIGPTRDTSNNPIAQGQLYHLRVQFARIVLDDPITGQPLVPREAIKVKGPNAKIASELFFLPLGVLVRDSERLALYKPGQDKPLWTRPPWQGTWHDISVDTAGKKLALISVGGSELAQILRVEDGASVGRVPLPDDMPGNYRPVSLSGNGEILAAIHEKQLRLFDAVSGKLLEKHAIAGDPYWRGVHPWSGGWLVSGESGSRLFAEPDKKWAAAIDFGTVVHVDEFETPRGKRLLLQGYSGQCCLANPADGKVEARWVGAEHGQYRAPAWNAVFAGGKALLRPTGWSPVLEVIDLRDLKIVASFHQVPMDKEIGLIAFTPDGWWDATPGAERHVAVFKEGKRTDEATRDEQRNPKLITKRLAALWR